MRVYSFPECTHCCFIVMEKFEYYSENCENNKMRKFRSSSGMPYLRNVKVFLFHP